MSRTVRAAILLLAFMCSACGEFVVEDKDFSDNRRNLDITSDNAEAWLWSAKQVVIDNLLNAGLYTNLDASAVGNLKLYSSFTESSDQPIEGTAVCVGGGELAFEYSRPKGGFDESDDASELIYHEAGDTFKLEYEDCTKEDGVVLDGVVSGTYESLEGYNRIFSESVTIDQCHALIERETEELWGLLSDEADSLVLEVINNTVVVRFYEYVSNSSNDLIEVASHTVLPDESTIVVKASSDNSLSAVKEDGVIIYRVEDGGFERIDCAEFRRNIKINVNKLTMVDGQLISSLHGEFNYEGIFRSPINREYVLSSDGASVGISSSDDTNAFKESFELNNLEWRHEYDWAEENSFVVSASAELIKDDVEEIAELQVDNLRGFEGVNFHSGGWNIFGREDELAAASVMNNVQLRFNFAEEGDSDGDGKLDFLPNAFSNSWDSFQDRDFIIPLSQ